MEPVIPPRAKLFIGILAGADDLFLRAEKKLIKKFGEIDFRTEKIPFTHTEYYSSIGRNIYKVFYSFKRLVKRDRISAIKLYTNRLEKKISGRGKRIINIDPGYLTLSNVFLASCKEFFHRIYLKKGIYLENEYRYVGKRLEFWDWTYPDYQKPEYLEFFYEIRRMYYKQLKK